MQPNQMILIALSLVIGLSGVSAQPSSTSGTAFKISKNDGVRFVDSKQNEPSIVCKGVLNVSLKTGSAPLEAGDAFRLLNVSVSGSISGKFSKLNLPALPSGLEWETDTLYTQGFIWVRETGKTIPNKPNVIILFADDLGYADAGFQPHGSKDIITPHIDSIAHNGVIFSAGYACGPVCAPSRGGLMTGQYQNRFALHDTPATYHRDAVDEKGRTIKGVPMQDGIPPGTTCFGHRMQDLGYATGMIGKWHGGETLEHYPIHRGFDEFFGFNNGATTYFIGDNTHSTPNRLLLRGMTPVEREDDYLTDAFGREAADFVNRHADEPFFLYVAFNAPHGPMQADDQASQALFNKNADELTLRQTLISMVYSMDLAVGNILDAVRSNGLEEKTMIVFFSDNGGIPKPTGGNESYNTPLRGKKGELWDGGIRVPFCMQWKGSVPAGLTYDFVVTGLDLMPTAVHMAGGKFTSKDIVDGNNLLPAVTGQTEIPPNDTVIWWHGGRWVARDNEWKLIDMDRNASTPPQLFHISEDIAETTDVRSEYPEIAQRLQKQYEEQLAEFDLETDASAWKKSDTYYMNITDPEYQVIKDPR